MMKVDVLYEIQVYIMGGVKYRYSVKDQEAAVCHSHAIITEGYFHNDGKESVYFPPSRIIKVKIEPPIETQYPDEKSIFI